MRYEITSRPSYSILKISLSPGESVTAEAGSMIFMSPGLEVRTQAYGGVASSLKRAFLGGESLFLNTFTAKGEGELWLAPELPGDVATVEIDGKKDLIVQDTSYLAHSGDIDIGIVFTGIRGLLAEGQLFWLKLSGKGVVWLGSYGALEARELKVDEGATIDNFHLVAMDSTVSWDAKLFSGLKSAVLGGEGIVVDLRGPGRVYMQTRNPRALADYVYRYVRARTGSR